MNYHIAQINIARAVDDLESPVMHGFVSRLDEINALADNAEGFVWRLQSDQGDATTIQLYDDPLIIVNMSVWESIEALKAYVYKSVHVELIRDREAWFRKMEFAHQAAWWVPEGKLPTGKDGKERLENLREHGPSEYAFSLARPFAKPD